jgi:hypothetical protein
MLLSGVLMDSLVVLLLTLDGPELASSRAAHAGTSSSAVFEDAKGGIAVRRSLPSLASFCVALSLEEARPLLDHDVLRVGLNLQVMQSGKKDINARVVFSEPGVDRPCFRSAQRHAL